MISRESTRVCSAAPGLVRVRHVQVANGVDMGGELWFSEENLPWLLDELRGFIQTERLPRVEESCGDDCFRVFEGGHEQAPFVHVLNRRAEGAVRSGLSGIQVSKSAVRDLIAQLTDV